MSSLLHELKNDDALLMMYAAGELPATERAEVDGRLAADAPLRAQLGRLRQLEAVVAAHLEPANGSAEPAAAEEAAIRRTVREMRRFQLERATRPLPAAAPRIRRPPAWSYPVIAVAASVMLLIGLWGAGALDELIPPPGAQVSNPPPTEPSPVVARDLERSFHLGRSMESLDEAAAHADALTNEEDIDPLLLMM
jgi:hypothetical protein